MTDTSSTPSPLPSPLSGRITAVALIALAALVGLGASQIEFAFSSDPLGPRAFPYLLSAVLGLCGIWYLVAPGDAEAWPGAPTLMRSAALIAVCALAIAAMNHVGFVVTATVICGVAAWMFGATPVMASVIAVAQAVFWYALFKFALGTYLPAGTLWFPG